MTETIDYGVVGNIKVSVLKDENTGEINVIITPQTNYGIIPMLDIDEVKLLSSKLLEIIDFTPNAKPEQKEPCSVCEGLEDGDTLYVHSDWDGGIAFDYINNIKYCPVCGRKLK